MDGRGYVDENARELARMRSIVERVSDAQLGLPVNDHWTVAAVLGHIAFWDGRALALGQKLQGGMRFSPSDDEPEDVDWINDASRPLIHAVPARELAQLAVRIAEETDALVAALPAERMWPDDSDSPLNPIRASHRGEHLDDVDRVLGEGG
ncbi:MAG TPA: DinB family protein [Actinomycetota bacterium]|nr:DinB family protein [Actinomycetota bacterium]